MEDVMARFTLPRDLYHGKGSLEALMVYDVLLPDNINEHEAFAKLKQLGEEDPQLQITWNSQLKTWTVHFHIL
jgi:hypothetical protein